MKIVGEKSKFDRKRDYSSDSSSLLAPKVSFIRFSKKRRRLQGLFLFVRSIEPRPKAGIRFGVPPALTTRTCLQGPFRAERFDGYHRGRRDAAGFNRDSFRAAGLERAGPRAD